MWRPSRVQIATGVQAELRLDAAARWPEEACGLIGGLHNDDRLHLLRYVPLANHAADRRGRFIIDFRDTAITELQLRKAGLQLIAVFHSHPNGSPQPSRRDQIEAAPGLLQCILGGRSPTHCQLAMYWPTCNATGATTLRQIELTEDPS